MSCTDPDCRCNFTDAGWMEKLEVELGQARSLFRQLGKENTQWEAHWCRTPEACEHIELCKAIRLLLGYKR